MSGEVQGAMGKRVVAISEDELGALFTQAQAGDQAAVDAALEALEPLISAVCRRYKARLSRDTALGPDDLIQQGRLYAMMAIKRWGGRDTIPGVYVTMAIGSGLHQWVGRAGDLNAAVGSLDRPIGESGEPVGQLIRDPALPDSPDLDAADLEGLLDRVPRAMRGTGDEYLASRLQPGRPNHLPDDEELADLIRQGRTVDDIARMFGASKRTISARLTAIRKSGIAVPKGKRQKGKPWRETRRLPWGEKLRIIANYLDSRPGVSNTQTLKDLGISILTLHKAREELAQVAR